MAADDKKAKAEAEAAAKAPKGTVKMKHETSGHPADVHPDEVENYRAGGYVEVK